mmetsp:Transcript_27486/g.79664  ORF Transcript_27486/g.79664 Transcript_27486/m.79664 type:complete len:212 (-) Transcript_27486:1306-1941(-)
MRLGILPWRLVTTLGVAHRDRRTTVLIHLALLSFELRRRDPRLRLPRSRASVGLRVRGLPWLAVVGLLHLLLVVLPLLLLHHAFKGGIIRLHVRALPRLLLCPCPMRRCSLRLPGPSALPCLRISPRWYERLVGILLCLRFRWRAVPHLPLPRARPRGRLRRGRRRLVHRSVAVFIRIVHCAWHGVVVCRIVRVRRPILGLRVVIRGCFPP